MQADVAIKPVEFDGWNSGGLVGEDLHRLLEFAKDGPSFRARLSLDTELDITPQDYALRGSGPSDNQGHLRCDAAKIRENRIAVDVFQDFCYHAKKMHETSDMEDIRARLPSSVAGVEIEDHRKPSGRVK